MNVDEPFTNLRSTILESLPTHPLFHGTILPCRDRSRTPPGANTDWLPGWRWPTPARTWLGKGWDADHCGWSILNLCWMEGVYGKSMVSTGFSSKVCRFIYGWSTVDIGVMVTGGKRVTERYFGWWSTIDLPAIIEWLTLLIGLTVHPPGISAGDRKSNGKWWMIRG